MTTCRAFALFIFGATFAAAAADAQRPAVQSIRARDRDVDSIRLERLPGHWGGPDYEILVEKSDRVTIRADQTQRKLFQAQRSQPGLFDRLVTDLLIADFAALPDTLQNDPVFGRVCPTDAPTAILTLYQGEFTKRVIDYQGCRWAPAIVRDLEHAIDHAAGRRPER